MHKTDIAPAGAEEFVLDVLWRKADRHGADLLLARVKDAAVEVHTLATVSWHPVYSDGWRRYAWDLPPRRSDQPPRLTVIGSPEVEIERVRSSGVVPMLPRVGIIRLQRADCVPQDGERVRVGDLLPLDLTVVASRIAMDDPFATAQLSAVPRTDLAHVRHLADGVVATHCDGQWEVRVTVPPEASAAFAFELTPAPTGGLRVLTRSAFQMRVVCHGPVEVTYRQLTTRAKIRPGWGVHGGTFSVVDVDVGGDDSPAPIPPSGLTLDRARRFAAVKAINQYPSWETTVANIVVILATSTPAVVGGVTGFTPLVLLGTLIDFGEPLYAMVTGRDFVGTEVSTDQIVLMGAFALVGAALDYGPEFMTLARSLVDELIPQSERAAVEAALTPQLAHQLLGRTAPMLAEAARGIGREDATRLVQAITSAVTSGAPAAMRELGGQLAAVLAPLLSRVATIDGIPEPLYREAMAFAHVADTEAYLALTDAERVLVAHRFSAAYLAQDPRLLRLHEISSDLAKEYTELVRDAIALRIFNSTLDGFRVTSMNNHALAAALGSGYEAYRAGKQRAGKVARDVLEWAYNQRPNSRYYPMLVAELGANFKELLRPIVQRARYVVDQAAAGIYDSVMDKLDSYEYLRGLLTGKKVGHLFQVDHILEKRFAEYFDALHLIGQVDFDSIVVPYNSIVVEGLKRHGITTFPYVHTFKTSRLRHWVPYGTEGKFTVQEIYDIYRLVYSHELGLGDRLKDTLNAIFTQFWRAVREEADEAVQEGRDITGDVRLQGVLDQPVLDTTARTQDELRASIIAARAARGIPVRSSP